MLDLKHLEETITDAMKETVSVIWLAELSVAVPGKTEICRKIWRKHCPIWLCTLFSSAKGFYTPCFFLVVFKYLCSQPSRCIPASVFDLFLDRTMMLFWSSCFVFHYFGICQADPDHSNYNVPTAVGLRSILHLLLPEIETN